LRPDEYGLCADEKSPYRRSGASMPRCRQRRADRFEFDYERNGTLAYLAGWDVHHANLFDRVEAKTGREPFDRLVDQVMSVQPYASARTVFSIVDNGSSHAGQASTDRLEGAYENLRLIHLPIHASWLNQIELYFSIVQRKALTPNDFNSLDALAERLLGFGDYYRQIAQPFEWTSTRDDLHRLLARIEPHQTRLALAA
jgi:DDE superfamily endonuclease